MGFLPCPCPFPCHNRSDTNHHRRHHHHHHHLHSESSSTSLSSSSSSLSSQCSLPSVPSLTPQTPLPQPNHHSCLSTLKCHSSYVSSLYLAGKTLFSSSSDGEIRFWTGNNPSGTTEQSHLVTVADSAVKSIIVLGDKLITAHQDHKIRVWKVELSREKCKLLITLPTLTDQLTRMFSTKNYVEVRRHKSYTWVHHADAVSSLALSRDGSLLFSVSWDRTLKVWRTIDFKCLESVEKAHDDAINAVVAGPGGVVYTGSADRKIKVWRKNHGDKLYSLAASLEKHRSAVNALALSEDGSTLYSGACDRSILVWEEDKEACGDTRPMVVVGALRGHSKAVLCLFAVADLVFSGSADNTVRIWRRGPGRSYVCVTVLEGHTRPVKCVAAAAVHGGDIDGNSCNSYMVYSGGLDCSIKVWHIRIPLHSDRWDESRSLSKWGQ